MIKHLVSVKKYYVLLSLICLITHGLLLIISGVWWDDWTLWTSRSITELADISSQGGGDPLTPFIRYVFMCMPDGVYRIIIYILFWLSALLFYHILSHISLFSTIDAFWIAAIFISIPVNDAKATLICSTYTIDLFLFLFAFNLLITVQEKKFRYSIVLRVVSLLLFFHSYFTESLLVFMSVVWIYLFYYHWNKNIEKNIFKKILIYFKSNWDYLVLPFVFFFFKNIFFTPYGAYADYNKVTIDSILYAVIYMPFSATKTFLKICLNYFNYISIISIITIVIILIGYFLFHRKSIHNSERKLFFSMKMAILGIFIFLVGIFPYIVVRNGNSLTSIGVDSRDTILTSFGISIFIYYMINMLNIPSVIHNCICIMIVMLGSLFFFNAYLNYQEDWFQQLELRAELIKNESYKNNNTFLCDFTNESPCRGTRFYSLNGLSYSVTKKKDKLFMNGISDLSYGTHFNKIYLEHYNMDEYDSFDTTIDGVFLIDNQPISNLDLLKMRFNEVFNYDEFLRTISDKKNVKYIEISSKMSQYIYQSYANSELNSANLRYIVASK